MTLNAQQPGVAPSPAQWALARMLDAAFDDRETAARCMELALKSAGRRTIPSAVEEMLSFGREHLLPIMAEEMGPRIVQALFDDLAAELARLRRSDIHTAIARPLKSSIPHLTVPPLITEAPSAPTIQSPAPSDEASTRPVIAIVEADRWTRASLARVLVQGGCDVLPLDGPSACADLSYDIDVIVIDVGDAELGVVKSLRQRRPALRVLAWTKLEATEAGRRLSDAGISAFDAIARTASPPRVAEAVKALVTR